MILMGDLSDKFGMYEEDRTNANDTNVLNDTKCDNVSI